MSCGEPGWECRNLRVCERPGRGCNIAVPTCIHKGTYGKLKLIKANNRALENIVLCSVHTRKGLETYF